MIERILSITLTIFAIALIGFFYTRAFKPNLSGANRISVDLVLPALIFTSLSAKDFAFGESGLLLVASTLLIFASGLLAWPLARLAGADRQAFLPCIMFGNVGPVGLPLTVLAFGEAELVPAVLLLVLSNILYFTVGVWIMSGKTDLKSVLLSPLVWSTVLGLAFSLLRFRLPEWVDVTLTMIGNILIPMMLLSLGARLAEAETTRWRAGMVGAIATPVVRAIAAVVLLQFLPLWTKSSAELLLCLRRFLQLSSNICSLTALAATVRGSRPSSWRDIWRALLFCRWRWESRSCEADGWRVSDRCRCCARAAGHERGNCP